MARILVIDDEECIRFTFKSFLEEEGHEALCAGDFDEGLARVSETEFALVFADLILGGKSGVDFLQECRRKGLSAPVVIITAYPDVQSASEAVRLGAFEYLSKPIERDALLRVARLALQHQRVTDEKERYWAQLDAVFRSVEDMIVTVDDGLVITGMNDAATELCGISGESVGKNVGSLGLGCTARCLDALRQTIRERRPVRAIRLECRHAGEVPQIVDVSTYPLEFRTGTYTGAVMVVRDQTRLVQLEKNSGDRQRLLGIVGRSRPMQEIYSLIEVLSGVDSAVLITGESGTGKELVAEALHRLGPRRQKRMVRVNCAALPEALLESELFGHVRGAFTGAISSRAGRFELADGGTLFLDEIGDLSPRMQSRLLRVLQSKEFERLGDSSTVRVNARIIAATNKHLREMVALGEFREDLLYRLEVVGIHVPPLRDRREDIPLLVEHFLAGFNKRISKSVLRLSSDVEEWFMEYRWPGNVRELEHVLEHAVVLCNQDTITMDHLPAHLTDSRGLQVAEVGKRHGIEPESIRKALQQTAGNKKRAARLLGIDRKTLYRNIAKYKLVDGA